MTPPLSPAARKISATLIAAGLTLTPAVSFADTTPSLDSQLTIASDLSELRQSNGADAVLLDSTLTESAIPSELNAPFLEDAENGITYIVVSEPLKDVTAQDLLNSSPQANEFLASDAIEVISFVETTRDGNTVTVAVAATPSATTTEATSQRMMARAAAVPTFTTDPRLAPAYTVSLGQPLSNAINIAGGIYQQFENGLITKKGTDTPRQLKAAMREYWETAGRERSWTGLPMTAEVEIAGGTQQKFANTTLYWSPSSNGAHAIKHGSAFESMWVANGKSGGYLGFPTTDEQAIPGGVIQNFEAGDFYYHSATGNTAIMKGAIRAKYRELGAHAGWLGFPQTGEIALTRSGVIQYFKNGIIYYSPSSGAHAISTSGAIFGRWRSTGYERGPLGYPTSSEYSVQGGRAQNFQNGRIYWNATTGATQITTGAIQGAYLNQGGPAGGFGLPKTDETVLNNGVTIQIYDGGTIYWTGRTGAYGVRGAMFDMYGRRGYERGFLGLPLSHEYNSGGQIRQNFEGGTLYWTPSSGAGVVGWEPANPFYFGPTKNPTSERGGRNLTPGWNGPKVLLVQKKLGTYTRGTQVTMNPKTIDAVKRWQRSHGLRATGVVDKQTWDSMGLGASWYIDGYTVQPRVGINASRQERIEAMISYSREQLGSQYTWGGAGPYGYGFDCSGLAIQAMNAGGLETGLTTAQHGAANWLSTHYFYKSKKFNKVPLSQVQRGDWIFYTDSNGVIRHMTMYLGNGQMIHAYAGSVHIRPYAKSFSGRYAAPYVVRPF